ncbi:hypothetical protein KP79_PYT00350 [Mizuhopecten yessoensis]|uniref:Uncharacterized protein n=1 Tax=Mizuhopecten yessoensis TaxID=6573 RepID=A0A210QZX7_MIZYE|nr:hypothetical protein KP79_PYT00350 [Mizuhopecten yessoensis]
MMKTYLLSCTCTAVLLLVCVTDARFLDDEMPSRLIKRTSSDQRIAELMALIALSRGGGGMIGHGRIDPNYVGRKKRDVSSLPIFKGQNAQRLLNKILRHSAEKL